VLILRALGLGDALTGVPALRGLRRAFPCHELVLAAPAGLGQWLRQLGLVDRIVPAAGLQPLPLPADLTAAERRPIAVNLHGRGPQSHRLLLATDPRQLIAFRDSGTGNDGPLWQDDEHEVDRWCRLVRSAGGPCDRRDLQLPRVLGRFRTSCVLVHPGAASGSRRWPVQRWAEVLRWLRAAGHQVLVTGGLGERQLCADIARGVDGVRSLAGTLSLAELAELVAAADLLICGDTGVAHLATAYRTASVLLFGPTSPRYWGPAIDPEVHEVLWHGARTGPGDPHGSDLDPALALITVEEVVSAADRMLSRLAATRD
jgi:ADP-heptose:LPS heptosyltransferase